MNRIPKAKRGELPSAYADRLGVVYAAKVSANHKKELGQFFTPLKVSKFIAGFSATVKERIQILDPGCGVGILSCVLVEELQSRQPNVKSVALTAFETDTELLPYTDMCLSYLCDWAKKQNIQFTYFLCKNDFILHNSEALEKKQPENEEYDIIITNPPYFKIRKNDARAIAAKSTIFGQSNIYSIFLLIAAKLLKPGGELIFITPRSFASGGYFRLFREKFFAIIRITRLHIFESRKEAFERDKILQENIIVKGVKHVNYADQLFLSFQEPVQPVIISASKGVSDLDSPLEERGYMFEQLVNLDSFQKILHIPSSPNDNKAISLFKSWNDSLSSFGIEISTGPVVDFRSKELIRMYREKNCVPLIYLHNVDKMRFTWPVPTVKGKNKGQFIIANEESRSRLLPNKDYVLLRRFSSKDDKSRLVAAPYTSASLRSRFIGVENHLNYIYRPNGELSKAELYGIAAILNSKLFDVYFRTFNGNINVSATELRSMPFPTINSITQIGENVMEMKIVDQAQIDQIIEKIFNIDLSI